MKSTIRKSVALKALGVALVMLVGIAMWGWAIHAHTRDLAIKYGHVPKAADRIYGVTITTHEGAELLIPRLHRLPDLVSLSTAEVKLSDEQLEQIGKLDKLTQLILRTADIDDGDLKYLSGLSALTELDLTANPIEGKGLVHLKSLHSLEQLDLTATSFAGPGIEQLAVLPGLYHLRIQSTKIDDDGMTHVAKLRQLRGLDFGNTEVSEAGLFKLVDSYWLVQPNFPDDIVGDPNGPQGLMRERWAMMRRFREARLEALRKARAEGKNVPPDSFQAYPYIPGD